MLGLALALTADEEQAADAIPADATEVAVVEVVDGDTIKVRLAEAEDDGNAYLANQLLGRVGYAVVSTYQLDVKHAERLTAAQDAATEECAGLWAECG